MIMIGLIQDHSTQLFTDALARSHDSETAGIATRKHPVPKAAKPDVDQSMRTLEIALNNKSVALLLETAQRGDCNDHDKACLRQPLESGDQRRLIQMNTRARSTTWKPSDALQEGVNETNDLPVVRAY